MASESSLPQLAVIGWPLETTFSPVMQQTALDESCVAWQYERIRVAPDALPAFLKRASVSMQGINVTTPHKFDVYLACHTVDEISRLSRAVNTVVFSHRGGAPWLKGHNTDGPGLLRALAVRARFAPDGARVLILGAGGAAAGCAAAMGIASAREVTLFNRTAQRAEDLCAGLRARLPGTTWRVASDVASASGAAREADLIVSCLPETSSQEMAPIVGAGHPGATFMDMSYSSLPTLLHEAATRAGLSAVPGLEMLLWQGAFAFEIFCGQQAPIHAMRDALASVAGSWWLEC